MSFNAANWSLVVEASLTKLPDPVTGALQPIPSFNVPGFTNRVIAIQASSIAGKPNWTTGGWVSQVLLTPNAPFPNIHDYRDPFHINKNTVITFPYSGYSYRLRVDIPEWMPDISLRFWKYTGP